MKYCVTIELESKAEAHEIIERLPLERPVYLSGTDRKVHIPWTIGNVSGSPERKNINDSRLRFRTLLFSTLFPLYNIYTRKRVLRDN